MDLQNTQKNDIREIRELMEKSSRFLSLSGLSSISAGIIALLGSVLAYIILDFGAIAYNEYMHQLTPSTLQGLQWYLLLDGLIVLLLAILFGFYFSWRKAKKNNLPFWNQTARRTLYYFTIPFLAGGIFTAILIIRNDFTLVASSTLIFYGLALFCASKYTFREIQYLGISEIVLGVFAGIFIHYGLLLWAIGFGVLHIIYGIIIYTRHS